MRRICQILILSVLMMLPSRLCAFTVVIDPGHGGRDPGCKGVTAKEKDITLKVALELGSLIKKKHGKKVKVLYTRTDDTYISLGERAQKANRNNADLFISIHVNSVEETTKGRETLQGSQVYTMATDKMPDNLRVIKKNVKIETINKKGASKAVSHNPDSQDSEIAYQLAASERNDRSLEFSRMALDQLKSKAKRADKGMRQGPFQVLWATAMPAVLVELDYMCNPEQEKYLNSKKGQKKCAEALAEAFNKYYKKHK